MGTVSKILPVLAVVTVVAAGCGGAAQPQRSADRGVPPVLAHGWEAQASAIAAAASTGDDCRALQLANTLRDQVRASERRVPVRLRSPLLTGVNALAARITCTPPPPKPPKPPKPPEPPKDKHDDHRHQRHHGHGGGDGKDR
jgi:hypothetical protein